MPVTAEHFERELMMVEINACRNAKRIIKRHTEMLPFPKADQHNVVRLGWGRPIYRRPKSLKSADFDLNDDMDQIRRVLHPRVVMLMAKSPISEWRLAVLYAIAETIDAERVRDWEALWIALEQQAWPNVMKELLNCDWAGLAGTTAENKEMFSGLVTVLVADQVPDGFV